MANSESAERRSELLQRLRDQIQSALLKCLDDKSPEGTAPARFQIKHIGMVSAGIAAAVRGMVDQMLAMEARMAERGFPYRGVWQKAEQYNRGDFVTHEGSMWHCNASTRERPGSGDDWQLAVKAGRDGKDAGR